MRDQLFTDICDRLNLKVPELQWIDKDWNQLDLPDQSYPLQFDCCLISFPEIPWDSLTRGAQDGVVSILIKVAVDMYNDTHIAGGVTAPDRALAVAKLQLVNKVHAALHGFEGAYFSKLTRKRSVEEKRNDGLLVFNEYYETRMQDNSGALNYEQATIAPNVTGNFDASI